MARRVQPRASSGTSSATQARKQGQTAFGRGSGRASVRSWTEVRPGRPAYSAIVFPNLDTERPMKTKSHTRAGLVNNENVTDGWIIRREESAPPGPRPRALSLTWGGSARPGPFID